MPVMDGIQATKEIRLLERQAAANSFASTPPPDGEQTPSDAASSDQSKNEGFLKSAWHKLMNHKSEKPSEDLSKKSTGSSTDSKKSEDDKKSGST